MLRQPDAEAHVHYRWGNYPHMNAVGQAMSTNCCETSDSEELMACKERFTQTDVQRPTEPALVANSLRSVGSTLYRAHIVSADALSSVLRSACRCSPRRTSTCSVWRQTASPQYTCRVNELPGSHQHRERFTFRAIEECVDSLCQFGPCLAAIAKNIAK